MFFLTQPRFLRSCVLIFVGLFAFLANASYTLGASGNASVDDLRISYPADKAVRIELSGEGSLNTNPAFYDNPPRLVFDLNSAILRYNKGQTSRITINNRDLTSAALAQFQTDPNIVRLVLYFTSGDENTLLKNVGYKATTGKFTIVYPSSGNIPDKQPSKPPAKETPLSKKQIIDKLFHKITGAESDGFVMMSPKPIRPSSSKFASGQLILNFDNFAFEIPKDSQDRSRFDIPINGALVDEIHMINKSDGATLELQMKKAASSTPIEYQLSYPNDTELRLDVMKSQSDDSMVSIKRSDGAGVDTLTTGEMKQLLGGDVASSGIPPTGSQLKINRIKYVPIVNGERFIFEVKTGELQPVFELTNDSSMLSMRFLNTLIATPKDSQDEYSVQVDGEIASEMRIVRKNLGSTPESVIEFKLDIPKTRVLKYDFYRTEKPEIYYLDLILAGNSDNQSVPQAGQGPGPGVELGNPDSGRESSGILPAREVSNVETITDRAVGSGSDENSIVEVPRASGGKIEQNNAAKTDSTIVDSTNTQLENDRIKTVPIPSSKDDNPFTIGSDSFQKIDTKTQNPELDTFALGLGKVFMPDTSDSGSSNFPLMMLVLFNKQTGSYVLYLMFLEDGKLKFQRFP